MVLTISTWGEGEPPDDGLDFFNHVRNLEPSSLANLRFAVFALGDTSYDNFCQCGRDLDRMFGEHGATRLIDRVDNDIDFQDALEKMAGDPPLDAARSPWLPNSALAISSHLAAGGSLFKAVLNPCGWMPGTKCGRR